ncbi:DUF554 domain-containing protein [Robertmurraya andreesenii]|uniref:Membrane protein YqgA involved in biofilm formation n=1 Tax=Anoxybacillus andreesenii TaxID=1325932 RepID=A0ABT9V8A0_9BACL|nr:DUF554 domain-containing protein [Robertmurraya andreesenii]MDQ0157181.1 putative membrane protein YqgA involved in biofilm formation [Robertmurraya andreesenii]
MPIGPIINSLAIISGGYLGALLQNRIPKKLCSAMPLTFGVASIGMGISSITRIDSLPPVILSLIVGSALGELINLEKGIEWCANKVQKPIERLFSKRDTTHLSPDYMEKFVGIVVLFSASGTGIFGSLNEGMTGDTSLLISKSFLDLFTATIFATSLGYIVMIVAIPQFLIMITLYFCAGSIMPFTASFMIGDFSAVGGIIMIATGLRISGIKSFPIANMLPALLIVMPISAIWNIFLG